MAAAAGAPVAGWAPAALELQAAIAAMYGHSDVDGAPVSAAAQRDAIAWLVRFADAPEAWGAYPQLLAASPHAAVRFYAANGVYALVCRDWTRLPPERQAGVASFLWASLARAPALELSALRRVCLALAAGAALSRTPGAVTQCVARAVGQLGGGAAAAAAQLASLELLRCLPEEAADKPLSAARSERVRLELAAASDSVLGALQAALAEPASPFHVGAAAASPPPALAVEGCAAACLTLHTWLPLGGVTLGGLGSRFPRLLRALLGALLAVGHPAVAAAAAQALESALAVRVHPRERGRDDALAVVAAALVGGVARVAGAARAGRWDLLRPIAATAGALALREDEWMAVRAASAPPPPGCGLEEDLPRLFPYAAASADAPRHHCAGAAGGAEAPPAAATIGGAPVGLGVLLGDLLLQLAGCRDRSVAALLASCLMGVQSLPMAERHPFFRAPVFAHLLAVTLEQARYRVPPHATEEAPDEFLAARGPSGEAADALADCAAALGAGAFLGVCTQWLARQQLAPGAWAPSAAAGLPGRAPAWLALEAVLHCVGTAARDTDGLLSCLGAPRRPPQPAAEGGASALASLLALATSGPVLAQPAGFPEVAASACRLVHELAGCAEPHLGDALAADAGGRQLLVSAAPPFASLVLLHSTATDAALAGGGGMPPSAAAAVVPLHSAALVEGMTRLLVGCLQLSGHAVPLLCAAPAADDLSTMVAAAGSSLRLPPSAPQTRGGDGAGSDGGGDDDGDDDDDDDDAAGGGRGHREGAHHAASHGDASLPWRAAGALCALAGARAARPFFCRSPRLLSLLVEGVEAGVSRGLPLVPSLRATEAVLKALAGVQQQQPQQGAAALQAAFAPLVARLGAAAAAAAAAACAGSSAPPPAAVVAQSSPLLAPRRHGAARGAPPPAAAVTAAAAAAELALCREAVLAMALVRSAAATEMEEQPPVRVVGGAAGGGAGAAGAPLDFLGDALWRACEVALPALAGRPDAAGVLLQGLRAVVRACPAVVVAAPGRVGALLSLAVQLYQAHLYPDALSVVAATLDGLPELLGARRYTPDGLPVPPHALGLPRDVVDSCGQLMAAVAATTLAAASAAGWRGAGRDVVGAQPAVAATVATLADEPLALVEYFRLCQSMLDTVPQAMLPPSLPPAAGGHSSSNSGGGGGRSLQDTLQLIDVACSGAAACTHSTPGASPLRCAADVLGALLSRDELLAQPGWAAAVDGAVGATIGSLVRSLLGALFDDAPGATAAWGGGGAASSSASSSVIEMLRLLFVRYRAHGVVGLALAALDEATAAAGAAGMPGGNNGGDGGGGAADLETGLPCLSAGERRALLEGAAALAATSPRRFKLVLSDLGKIGRRQLAKDALLAHMCA